MTEKDLEIQQLRRENEQLRKIAWDGLEMCLSCKYLCRESERYKCKDCRGHNWELANVKTALKEEYDLNVRL